MGSFRTALPTSTWRSVPEYTFPPPDRQVYIHAFLDAARPTVLHDAVRNAVRSVPPATLSAELQAYAPATGLAMLQGTTVRDELVFAVPSALRASPSIVGYYRLLLGISQKQFYATSAGLSQFKSMEDRGVIRKGADADIPDLCRAMNDAIGAFLAAIPTGTLRADVEQLPLITLGAQADGSWRNRIGERATLEVYNALKQVIIASGQSYTDVGASLTVTNSSGREVVIALSPDPDVEIRERLGDRDYLRAAIEIKGGSDNANVHNRAGEAEKSHQKAKGRGANAFWTIIACNATDLPMLRAESPTTQQWFAIDEVRAGKGNDWDNLVAQLRLAMGI